MAVSPIFDLNAFVCKPTGFLPCILVRAPHVGVTRFLRPGRASLGNSEMHTDSRGCRVQRDWKGTTRYKVQCQREALEKTRSVEDPLPSKAEW